MAERPVHDRPLVPTRREFLAGLGGTAIGLGLGVTLSGKRNEVAKTLRAPETIQARGEASRRLHALPESIHGATVERQVDEPDANHLLINLANVHSIAGFNPALERIVDDVQIDNERILRMLVRITGVDVIDLEGLSPEILTKVTPQIAALRKGYTMLRQLRLDEFGVKRIVDDQKRVMGADDPGTKKAEAGLRTIQESLLKLQSAHNSQSAFMERIFGGVTPLLVDGTVNVRPTIATQAELDHLSRIVSTNPRTFKTDPVLRKEIFDGHEMKILTHMFRQSGSVVHILELGSEHDLVNTVREWNKENPGRKLCLARVTPPKVEEFMRRTREKQ